MGFLDNLRDGTTRTASTAKSRLDAIIIQMRGLREGTDLRTLERLRSEATALIGALSFTTRLTYKTKIEGTYRMVKQSISENIAKQKIAAANAAALTQQSGNVATTYVPKPPPTQSWVVEAIANNTNTGIAGGLYPKGDNGMGDETGDALKSSEVVEEEKSFFESNKTAIIGVGAVLVIGAGIFFMRKK